MKKLLLEKYTTIFTAKNFQDMLETDMWVIKQIQVLPEDPSTETTSEYDAKTGITPSIVKFVTNLSMPAQQEAVKQYRCNHIMKIKKAEHIKSSFGNLAQV